MGVFFLNVALDFLFFKFVPVAVLLFSYDGSAISSHRCYQFYFCSSVWLL